MKIIEIKNLYGIKDGDSAYFQKAGDGCFQFVGDMRNASFLTDDEASRVLEHKSWYLKQYNADTMECVEVYDYNDGGMRKGYK